LEETQGDSGYKQPSEHDREKSFQTMATESQSLNEPEKQETEKSASTTTMEIETQDHQFIEPQKPIYYDLSANNNKEVFFVKTNEDNKEEQKSVVTTEIVVESTAMVIEQTTDIVEEKVTEVKNEKNLVIETLAVPPQDQQIQIKSPKNDQEVKEVVQESEKEKNQINTKEEVQNKPAVSLEIDSKKIEEKASSQQTPSQQAAPNFLNSPVIIIFPLKIKVNSLYFLKISQMQTLAQRW
jgi:hypothetical protein